MTIAHGHVASATRSEVHPARHSLMTHQAYMRSPDISVIGLMPLYQFIINMYWNEIEERFEALGPLFHREISDASTVWMWPCCT